MIQSGERVRYRSGPQIREQKSRKIGNSANTWFMKGEWTNTVKVQCSPEGRLRDLVQNKLNEVRGPDGGLTKVVESVGMSVHSVLKKNPFVSSKCKYNEECFNDSKDDCS